MESQASEILINAKEVTHNNVGYIYEFILNDELFVVDCVKIESQFHNKLVPIRDAGQILQGFLFELHHVRVNPSLDNTRIIAKFTEALKNIDVGVSNPPAQEAIATCFKPLGEISHNVRFYLNHNSQLILLSPAMRPKIVHSSKSTL